MFPLPQEFYFQDTLTVAKELLNCLLICDSSDGRTVGRISETEAYTQDDPACHTFRGKTQRNEMMFAEGGVAYIYFTYGMYHCFNAVTNREGIGEAVLIRAVEPLEGLELMYTRRNLVKEPSKSTDPAKLERERQREGFRLCGGPGKICQAFGFDRSLNGNNLTIAEQIWIATSLATPTNTEILATPRIGISVATDYLWRFTLKNDPFVSKK